MAERGSKRLCGKAATHVQDAGSKTRDAAALHPSGTSISEPGSNAGRQEEKGAGELEVPGGASVLPYE